MLYATIDLSIIVMVYSFREQSPYHILLIAIIGLLAYSNTFTVPFHFDDTPNIVENPIIKDLRYFAAPASLKGLQSYDALKNRFIGYFSFALNYQLHGLDVTGYHIVNLAIHITNALLVYWLILLTFSTPYFASRQDSATCRPSNNTWPASLIALFSALLYVSHPVQTQAVTYIVQRFASLATMFYLLSLVSYVKWRGSFFLTLNPELDTHRLKPAATRFTSVLWYIASLVSAVFAMKTKEIAFTLPVIIVLYELMFFEGTIKKRALWLVPILLTLLIIPLTLISMAKPIGAIISDAGEATRLESTLSRWEYLFTQFRVIVTYIRLVILPINQNLDYDYPSYHSLLEIEVLLSFLFLAAFIALAAYLTYRSHRGDPFLRLAGFGILWFFITLSVESSIMPIRDVMFEHRLYLPSAGAFLAITQLTFTGVGAVRGKWPWRRAAIVPTFMLIIALLTGAAYSRNSVWRNELRLWSDVVTKSPQNARGHCSLGDALEDDGQTSKAIEHYRVALQLNPSYGEARSNLGYSYLAIGQRDQAIEQFQAALILTPLYWKRDYFYASVNYNLGIAYSSKGAFDKAREYFRAALKIKPNYARAYYGLGDTYLSQGAFDTAEGYYRIAIKIKPDYTEARQKLDLIHLKDGFIDNDQ